MSSLIQFRRDTAANWASANPVLAEGELGLVTDTGGYRIGNGATAFNSLPTVTLSPEALALTLIATTDPGATAADKLMLYAKPIAGRIMAKMVGPSGMDTALQPFLGRNKVGYWNPSGNVVTAPGIFGYTPLVAVGTATARGVATTNMFTRMRRIGYRSATTAGSLASLRTGVAQVTAGGAAGAGFFKVCRFGVSDPAFVTGARMFVGVSNVTSAPTNVEPSTLTNSIGVGHGAADTNLKLYWGGSTAQAPIDLGANFPITSNTDPYELALFAPPSTADVFYEVTRLSTGNVSIGLLNSSGGVALPPTTTLLDYMRAWRSNNLTALEVGLDLMSDYIETDN